MRRTLVAALSLTALLLAAPAALADTGEIVVLEDANRSAQTETAQRERALDFEADHVYDAAVDGFAADLTPAQVEALRADPEVAMVVPDRVVRATSVVRAANPLTVPPGVHRVTRTAGEETRERADGAVAIVDTGIDLDHPDLNVVGGKSCVEGDPSYDDSHGHGTHVAGIIGAENDDRGVTGVAPGTALLAVKVLDDGGQGTLGSMLCGLEWVLAHAGTYDITVANFSLGSSGPATTCKTDPEHQAFCALANAGITPVVAAGNEGVDFNASGTRSLPAAFPQVLTVSAIADGDGRPGRASGPVCGTSDDTSAGFSNFATRAADEAHLVAAPGVCVLSTVPDSSPVRQSGTSMAAPHVAGLVALCKSEDGEPGPCAGLTTPQVIARMRITGEWGLYTGLAGRMHGPLAFLADPSIATPAASAVTDGDPVPATRTQTTTAPGAPAQQPPATVPPGGQAGTPGTPAVSPPAPPRSSPAVRRASIGITTPRLATLRRRGLRVKLTCSGPCTAELVLRISRRDARRLKLRSTTIAHAYAAGAGRVRLRLDRRACRALTRVRRITVRLTTAVDLRDRTVRTTKALTLR